MEEIWKDVVGYEGHYQVSNMGRVRSLDKYVNSGGLPSRAIKNQLSLKTGKFLKSSIQSNGYARVNLSINSKIKQFLVHRLVADHFLEQVLNKNNVNHINGIKTDNYVENLEYVNQRENVLHSKIFVQKKKYPYVSYLKKQNRFEASIQFNNKTIKLGRFKTEEEALLSYINKLKEINQENKYAVIGGT